MCISVSWTHRHRHGRTHHSLFGHLSAWLTVLAGFAFLVSACTFSVSFAIDVTRYRDDYRGASSNSGLVSVTCWFLGMALLVFAVAAGAIHRVRHHDFGWSATKEVPDVPIVSVQARWLPTGQVTKEDEEEDDEPNV